MLEVHICMCLYIIWSLRKCQMHTIALYWYLNQNFISLIEFDLRYTWIKGLEEALFGAIVRLLRPSKLFWDHMMKLGALRQILWQSMMMSLRRLDVSLMLRERAFTRFLRRWRKCLRWIQTVCYAYLCWNLKFDLIHHLWYWWVVIYFGIRNICK